MRSKALFLTLALGGAFVGGVTYSALNTTNTDGSAAAPYATTADAGSCPMMSSSSCGDKAGCDETVASAAAPSEAQLAAFDAALDGKPAKMAAAIATPAAETSFAAERDATFSPASALNAPLAEACPTTPGCCDKE